MVAAFSEWGIEGARRFGSQVDVIVIVDVLSFSTCVDIAASRGASVYPFASGDRAAASRVAQAIGAELAGPRGSPEFRYTLSPASLTSIPKGAKLILPSPNGSAISAIAHARAVLAGCLRNARAIAEKCSMLAESGSVAVIPAGERWPDGSLRPAIEDLIGTGAILHELGASCSPEAEIAREAFRYAQPRLADIIRSCVSGRELIERGYPEDVEIAIDVNASRMAPMLCNGAYGN